MPDSLWINLPVKNVNLSRIFFTQIGFTLNTQYGNSEHSASFLVGKMVVMLFNENTFKSFIKNELTDTKQGNEVLFSIGAASKEDVNEIAEKVIAAGGNVFSAPAESQGWMYGCAFSDPDGHRWNSLYMDMSKMPKG